MKTQVRILFALAAVALLAGWLGLRRGNAALEAKVADGAARRAQAQPDEAGPAPQGAPKMSAAPPRGSHLERAGDWGTPSHRAPQQEVSR